MTLRRSDRQALALALARVTKRQLRDAAKHELRTPKRHFLRRAVTAALTKSPHQLEQN